MEAEKKLISLQVRVETLKEKYNVEKQQNHKYKVQEYGFDKCNNNLQGSHRLEKYLNLVGFLEKSLKIKSALKSSGKRSKSLNFL